MRFGKNVCNAWNRVGNLHTTFICHLVDHLDLFILWTSLLKQYRTKGHPDLVHAYHCHHVKNSYQIKIGVIKPIPTEHIFLKYLSPSFILAPAGAQDTSEYIHAFSLSNNCFCGMNSILPVPGTLHSE